MSFESKVSSALVGASLVFAGTNVAQAAPLLSITNTVGQTLGNPPFTLGFEFTATSTFWATDLGFFDSSADGLAEAHAIGLWDNSGTLLASTVLPSGMAGTLVSGFRYVPIAPVLLTPGSYRVGALFSSGADPVVFQWLCHRLRDAFGHHVRGEPLAGGCRAFVPRRFIWGRAVVLRTEREPD